MAEIEQQPRRCPSDGEVLLAHGPARGWAGTFTCLKCRQRYAMTDEGILGIDWSPTPLPLLDTTAAVTWPNLGASLASFEMSTGDFGDRIARLETVLSALQTSPQPASPKTIELVQRDAAGALDSARGAMRAADQVRKDMHELKTTIEALNLVIVRARVAEIEKWIEIHASDRHGHGGTLADS